MAESTFAATALPPVDLSTATATSPRANAGDASFVATPTPATTTTTTTTTMPASGGSLSPRGGTAGADMPSPRAGAVSPRTGGGTFVRPQPKPKPKPKAMGALLGLPQVDTQRTRRPTLAYSMHNLYNMIQGQDANQPDVLAAKQMELLQIKRDISTAGKQNFTLSTEIRNLDEKIALLIRNRITFEEVMASSGDLSVLSARTITLKDKREREFYGQLFYHLQAEPAYLASLARLTKLGEIDNLLQTVMFTLYGNQYDENEERLLLRMFKTVLHEEFAAAPGIGTFLRGNSAVTRMMTTYTRREAGQTYLKSALSDVLASLIAQANLVLEINPMKVFDAWVNQTETATGQSLNLAKPTPEEAAARVEVQQLIAPRITTLGSITDQFVDALIASFDTVPMGIRYICHQIHSQARVRFPEATREQLLSLVGGFYLLRFVNPAVVTPQTFMDVESGKVSADARRNLTLLAKILQNLANNVQFGGVKEFFMEPLNAVLDKNKNRLNELLERIAAPPPESTAGGDHDMSFERYVSLSKSPEDRTINISLNEIYFIHNLLAQHEDEVARSSDDPLHSILKALGKPPEQIPKKDNLNVDLKLYNAHKDTGDDDDVSPEQLYVEVKHSLLYLIKMVPSVARAEHGSLDELLAAAASSPSATTDSAVADAIEVIRTCYPKVVECGYLSATEGFFQLRKAAVKELSNYEENLRDSDRSLDRFKGVLHKIQEHNKSLHSQYDAYKTYLSNVKDSCSAQAETSAAPKNKKKSQGALGLGPAIRKKVGSARYPYTQLEKDGVIIESQVPEDKRSKVLFMLSTKGGGLFEVSVMYQSRHIFDFVINLDDLLDQQNSNDLVYKTDFASFNVNLLLYLLNKAFLGEKKGM